MRFKIPIEGGDDTINMAPMIDMVFLLLIFFMAASHLTKLERVPVLLPEASHAKVPEKAGTRQVVTLLATDDSGEEMEIYMNLQKMSLEEFAQSLEAVSGGETAVPLYLRVDRRLRHRHIRKVMQTCAEAGIADVIFGAFESGK